MKVFIDQLHNSVQVLMSNISKWNYNKEILQSPELYPGFYYENWWWQPRDAMEVIGQVLSDLFSIVLTTALLTFMAHFVIRLMSAFWYADKFTQDMLIMFLSFGMVGREHLILSMVVNVKMSSSLLSNF